MRQPLMKSKAVVHEYESNVHVTFAGHCMLFAEPRSVTSIAKITKCMAQIMKKSHANWKKKKGSSQGNDADGQCGIKMKNVR